MKKLMILAVMAAMMFMPGDSNAQPKIAATGTLAAENTWTAPLVMLHGSFNFSLSGTWVGTVTVQRRYYGSLTWFDVDTFTANAEEVGDEPEHSMQYRAGFKTGEFTSGTAVIRLSQ